MKGCIKLFLVIKVCVLYILLLKNNVLFANEFKYVFTLKDGSNVVGFISQELLNKKNEILDVKTAYGILKIPFNDIINFYQVSSVQQNQSNLKDNEIKDEKVSQKVNSKNSNKNIDEILNLDDEQLFSVLESNEFNSIQNTNYEIQTLKSEEISQKYQLKEKKDKKLVPVNLTLLEDDIKALSNSKTEETWLKSKFTKEIQLEKKDTVPIEVIGVSVNTSKDNQKNEKVNKDKEKKNNEKPKDNKNEKETSKATKEVEVIGNDELSKKISNELKKYSKLSPESVINKSNLESEIEKYFNKPNLNKESTQEVQTKKKETDKKTNKK